MCIINRGIFCYNIILLYYANIYIFISSFLKNVLPSNKVVGTFLIVVI